MGTINSVTEFTGKFGNMVGYKKKDGTYGIRKYQRKPHNPKSSYQMAVRTSIANIVAFWKAMMATAHPNFTNKPTSQSDYNAFFQANYGVNTVYLTKEDVRKGVCIAAPYLITRGSLPTIGYIAVSGGKMKSDIALADLAITGETTVRDIAGAIIDSNNDRFAEGDMLTVIYAKQVSEMVGGDEIYHVNVSALRIPIDLTDDTLLADLPNGDIIGVTDGYLSSKGAVNGGFAIVHSRLVDGKVEVSTQTFNVNNNLLAIFTGNSAKQAAMLSYGVGKDPFYRPITNTGGGDEPVNP